MGFYVDVKEDKREFGLMRQDGTMYGGLGEFSLDRKVLEVVQVERVRGSTQFVLPVRKENKAKYLDVFRGKPG